MAIKVEKYRPYEKNTLKGFVDLKLTNVGMIIHECTHHQKDGSTWVGYPVRPYEKDGERLYQPIVRFDDDAHKAFQQGAVKAIQDYLEGASGPS